MNGHAARHRLIDIFSLSILGIFFCSALLSCEETCYDGELNNSEENVDCGGPCIPCDTTNGTCFDGIQNQGESGIDCGGPCNDCITDTTILNPDFLCIGTGGSSYFPLSIGSYWIYAMPSNQWFQLEISEEITLGNGNDYFHMITTGAFGTVHDYYRNVGGDIYRWNDNLSIEEVYIPANPTVGFQWTTATSDSIIVQEVASTVNSQNGCTYDDVLKITSYNGGNASTNFYKQGLGLIQLSAVSAYLDSAVVY